MKLVQKNILVWLVLIVGIGCGEKNTTEVDSDYLAFLEENLNSNQRTQAKIDSLQHILNDLNQLVELTFSGEPKQAMDWVKKSK
jgi:hypothetical protein